jgi:signal transduction histidine kinase
VQTAQTIRTAATFRADTAAIAAAALAGGMLVVAIAFVTLRVAAPTDGVTGSYVTTSWSAQGMTVTPLTEGAAAAAGGLRAEDRVVSAAGRPLEAWAAAMLDPGLARPALAPGTTVSYQVERDGTVRPLALPLAPYPLAGVLAASWSTLLWVLAMAGVGMYLFARRPHEAATRALLVGGCAALGSTLPWVIGLGPADLVAGGPLPILYLVATFGVYSVFWSAALHFALVFPGDLVNAPMQGRLVRLAYLVPIGAQAAWMAGSLPFSTNALGWIGGWTGAQLVIVPAVILAALVAVVLQWRHAAAVQRARLRWMTGASLVAIAGVLGGWFLPAALTGDALLPWSAIGLPGMGFPVALGMAVGRHQLFGIETILRRSLVYGGLTAGVVAAYAGSVVVLGTILPGDGPYAVTLLATGVAALVALPLRDRLQRGVARLLYGDRDEPYRALERLGRRLEASLEPGLVLPMVAETVAGALRLPYVAIELSRDDGVAVAAAHGDLRPTPERLPLVHHGEAIGWLALAQRATDEPFTTADRALLAQLARQAGAAAYAVRLNDELRRSRQQLVSAREEERRRLRRDLHDGVGPSLAAALMKLEAARAVTGDDPAALDRVLDELVTDTRRAIDDIRRAAYELRPPALDQLGLPAALEQEARRLAPPGVTVSVTVEGNVPALPAAVEVAAYRIGLEAMTNVAHHAAASRAWVRLVVADGALRLEVRDDGTGPTRVRSGVGMTSMRERAEELSGSLEVGRAQEGGLRVAARLPLPDGPSAG